MKTVPQILPTAFNLLSLFWGLLILFLKNLYFYYILNVQIVY